MRASARWAVICLLAAVTLGWLAADNSEVRAAQASNRTGTWDFTIPIRYFGNETLDFDGGTTVEINEDIGWGFGFGYSMSENLNLGMEFGWTSASYKVNFGPGDAGSPGLTGSATGTLDVFSTQFNATYYFMAKTFTPYVSAGVGLNWFDTNIPQGPPQTGCWWDPWYGYICTSYQDTVSESGFSYGLGAGVRIEPKPTFFMRVGLNENWQDIGSYSDTPGILSYRFDLGWKF